MQQKDGTRKSHILDTNVLLHDSRCICNFKENNAILPTVVPEELGSLRSREDLCGCQARQAVREFSKTMEEKSQQNIWMGIPFERNILFRVEPNGYHNMSEYADELDLRKDDSHILLATPSIQKKEPETTAILASKNICMRLKAEILGLKSEGYETDRVIPDNLYQGHTTTIFPSKEIDKLYESGLKCPKKLPLCPDQFVLIHTRDNPEHTTIARFDGERLIPLRYENRMAWGLTSLSLEQGMAFELMMDDTVKFVSITGGADSGETILATTVALEKVVERRACRKIVSVRPVVPAGDDIGFLPRNEEERLHPWMGNFHNAIENLMYHERSRRPRENCTENNVTVDSLIGHFKNTGIIDMKTSIYMRGRTLFDAIVIVNETQETTPHTAKLMLTWAGQDSKFIFIGDPTGNQIDNSLVDSRSNGLVYLVGQLKNSNLTGHITLSEVGRSPLAKLAECTLRKSPCHINSCF